GLIFGELSRVVVHLDFRGAGLSQQLTAHAVELAKGRGVCELFLECLPIHKPLYGKAGFRELPYSGRVYSVNKTMVVMHQPLRSESIVDRPAVPAADPGSAVPAAPAPARRRKGTSTHRRGRAAE